MRRIFFSLLLFTNLFAVEFKSANYFSKNYLFDAQVYSVNTFISESSINHQLGNFTPHLDFVQYQGLDKYKESDFGFGSEYKLSEKLNLNTGSWYYYYYSAGDHYFEPYLSFTYDWIVSPTIYFSVITYNDTPRSTISFDYGKDVTEKLQLNIKPVVGTADYDTRYGYYGIVFIFDYNINKNLILYFGGEVDKPFNSPDNSIVYTYSSGIKISL